MAMAGLSPAAVTVAVVLLLTVATSRGSQLRPPIVTDADGNTADKDSNITWGENDETPEYKMDGTSFEAGSLKGLFGMTNGFINVVMSKEPPFDVILDAANGSISSESQSVLISHATGLVACVAVGVLLAVCVPFCGCCFCCCRCCGNCGGKRVQNKPSLSRCRCYTVTLTICTIMTFCGAAVMLGVNNRAKSSGGSIEEIVLANLDDLATFFNSSAKDLRYVGVGGFRFVGKVVMRDLDNIDILVGKKVVKNLDEKGHATDAIDDIIKFDTTVNDVSPKMEKLFNDEKKLEGKGVNLTSKLNDRKVALKAITDGGRCTSCSTYFDYQKLAMDADYTALPFILVQVIMVKAVASSQPSLASSAREGKKELNDIPTKVLNDSQTQRDDVRTLIDNFVDTIDNQTEKLADIQEALNLTAMKKSLSDALAPLSAGTKYSWYAVAGLGTLLILIVILQMTGLLLGTIGYGKGVEPADRSAASNLGGNCLMASVGFIIIFFALFMTILIIFFTIGTPVQKFVCAPMMDPELKALDQLLDGDKGLLHKDGYYLGKLLLKNNSIPLTFKSVLMDCQDNKPAYSALRLDSMFDLEEMTNYEDKMDINGTMDKIDVNMASVILLSNTTEALLRNFSQAVQLNYQGFRDELQKNTTKAGKDLRAFIQGVRNAAGDNANRAVQNDLNTEADKLQILNDNLLRETTTDQGQLLVQVNVLDTKTANIPTLVDDMINSTKVAEKYIQDKGANMVKLVTRGLVDRILATANQFRSHVLKSVKEDMMRCKPMWNLWESVVHVALCGYGVQVLNGLWFTLGWCIFFLFFGMIFSVKTAKYFHRMTGGPLSLKSGQVDHYDSKDPSTKYSAEGAHENDLTSGGDAAALDAGVTKVLRPV